MSKTDNIFNDSPCLSEEQLLNYVQQKMNSVEMNSAERHLLDCDLCTDAVDGLQQMKDSSKVTAMLVDVRKNLNQKLKKKENKKIIGLDFRVMLAAASVLLLLGLSWMMMKYEQNSELKKSETAFKENFEPYHPENKPDTIKSADKQSQLAESPDLPMSKLSGPIKKLIGPPVRNDVPTQTAGNKNDGDKWKNNLKATDSVSSPQITFTDATTTANKNISTTPQGNFYTTSPNLNQQDSKNISGLQNQTGGNISSNAYAPAVANGSSTTITATSPTTVDGVSGGTTYSWNADVDKKANTKSAVSQTTAPAAAGYNLTTSDLSNVKDETISDSMKTVFEQGLTLYEQKNYDDANDDFSKVKITETDFYSAQFYSGVSYLALQKADSAIMKFNYVLGFPSQNYFDDAQWYKALALVKQNKKEDAKVLLKALDSSADYKSKAKKLLKDLGN